MPQLIVVGSGIKTLAHLTLETQKVINYADKVLYLVNEENLKAWLKREAKCAESLESVYFHYPNRVDAYEQITQYILAEYQKVETLCVVFYGHPTVFAQSALEAVKQIKAAHGHATILPAVSALDCLFADLQIDPGEQGFFAIDATELLLYERTIDVYAHTVIWQAANLGRHDVVLTQKLALLGSYLSQYYAPNQPICIYEAAILPLQKPRIKWITLEKLADALINPISTLYIAPKETATISNTYRQLLGITEKDYQLSDTEVGSSHDRN